MTSLSLPGKIAVMVHCWRHPGHKPAADHDDLGMTNYYCETCGYPLMLPEEWAESTGQEVPDEKHK